MPSSSQVLNAPAPPAPVSTATISPTPPAEESLDGSQNGRDSSEVPETGPLPESSLTPSEASPPSSESSPQEPSEQREVSEETPTAPSVPTAEEPEGGREGVQILEAVKAMKKDVPPDITKAETLFPALKDSFGKKFDIRDKKSFKKNKQLDEKLATSDKVLKFIKKYNEAVQPGSPTPGSKAWSPHRLDNSSLTPMCTLIIQNHLVKKQDIKALDTDIFAFFELIMIRCNNDTGKGRDYYAQALLEFFQLMKEN